MTDRIAFIFPGQGAQYPGMGLDFYEKYPEEKAVFDRADVFLKRPFSKLIFEGPKEIRDYYIVRYQSLDHMKHQMVKEAPKYYQYLSKQFSEDSIIVMKYQIEGWMHDFKNMYSEAVFPKVYVVPGVLNSGGTLSEMGLYIGGDMYGRSDDMPTEGLNDWQKKVIMVT